MKFRLNVKEENENEVHAFLQSHDVQTADDGEYAIIENTPLCQRILVRQLQNGEKVWLDTDTVIYLESYDHTVYLHGTRGEYSSSEPLHVFEALLHTQQYVRVSVSVIVSVAHIKEIRPSIGQKYVLLLTNDALVDVTRSYYVAFKNRFKL